MYCGGRCRGRRPHERNSHPQFVDGVAGGELLIPTLVLPFGANIGHAAKCRASAEEPRLPQSACAATPGRDYIIQQRCSGTARWRSYVTSTRNMLGHARKVLELLQQSQRLAPTYRALQREFHGNIRYKRSIQVRSRRSVKVPLGPVRRSQSAQSRRYGARLCRAPANLLCLEARLARQAAQQCRLDHTVSV